MSILVIGGAGYIGSHTCVELLEAGYGEYYSFKQIKNPLKERPKIRNVFFGFSLCKHSRNGGRIIMNQGKTWVCIIWNQYADDVVIE